MPKVRNGSRLLLSVCLSVCLSVTTWAVRTGAEGAEGQPVVPRSRSLGRVCSQLERVVSVGVQAVNACGQLCGVGGGGEVQWLLLLLLLLVVDLVEDDSAMAVLAQRWIPLQAHACCTLTDCCEVLWSSARR